MRLPLVNASKFVGNVFPGNRSSINSRVPGKIASLLACNFIIAILKFI